MLALATGAYSRIRRQFKLPIGKMEGIEEPLARLGGNAYIMGAAAKLTVTGIDLGENPRSSPPSSGTTSPTAPRVHH